MIKIITKNSIFYPQCLIYFLLTSTSCLPLALPVSPTPPLSRIVPALPLSSSVIWTFMPLHILLYPLPCSPASSHHALRWLQWDLNLQCLTLQYWSRGELDHMTPPPV